MKGISEASRESLGKARLPLALRKLGSLELSRGSATSERLEAGAGRGRRATRAALLHLKTGIFLKMGSWSTI